MNNQYHIVYQHFTWVVVNSTTNQAITSFPTQIMASKYIANLIQSDDQ